MPRSSSRLRLAATSLVLVAAPAVLTACDAGSPAPGAPAPAVEAEPAKTGEGAEAEAAPRAKAKLTETRFGQPLSSGDTTQLAAIVADPARFAGKSVKTEGVVKSVCQSAGCWMEIEADAPEGGSGRAHVKMAGHSFYVPKNCDGHRAVIEGTVKGAPEDTCGAKDSCGGSENGALAKLEIAATGVEFVD